MPALNFKKEFWEKVKSGEKRQTIRALRKDGRNPHVGEMLYLYGGMRTKGCQKLGESICISVEQITIEENWNTIIGVNELSLEEMDALHRADGFDSYRDFYQFFSKVVRDEVQIPKNKRQSGC